MNIRVAVLFSFLVISFLHSLIFQIAKGQESDVMTIETKKFQYNVGEPIKFVGKIQDSNNDDVQIQIFDPRDKLIHSDILNVTNAAYSYEFRIEPSMDLLLGQYRAVINSGTKYAETTFRVANTNVIDESGLLRNLRLTVDEAEYYLSYRPAPQESRIQNVTADIEKRLY